MKNKQLELANILKKSMVPVPPDLDINTVEEAQHELASGTNPWVSKINELVKDADYGEEPKSLELPNYLTLNLAKIDDGIFSGHVVKANSESGEYGDIMVQLNKMTPVAMVQALKAMGYLPMEERPDPEETVEQMSEMIAEKVSEEAKAESQEQQLLNILRQIKLEGDLHVHLHKGKQPLGD